MDQKQCVLTHGILKEAFSPNTQTFSQERKQVLSLQTVVTGVETQRAI